MVIQFRLLVLRPWLGQISRACDLVATGRWTHLRADSFHISKQFVLSSYSTFATMADDKFTVESPESALPPPPERYNTLPEYLLLKAKENADKGKSHYIIDAITFEKRKFSNYDTETRRVASFLHKAGMRKGDVVIYMPAQLAKLHVFLSGVWRANGVCRASYPDDDPETLEFRVKESNCKHILVDADRINTCIEAAKRVSWPIEIITSDEKVEGYKNLGEILETDDGERCPALEITGDDHALMLCTSGTTGPPKAAVLNHGTLVHHLHNLSYYPFTESKPNLMFSTATHYSGTVFNLSFIATGKTAIVSPKITKELLFKTVEDMKPGLAFAFPTYLLTLVSPEAEGHDFSSLEVLLTGGGMVTPAIRDALLKLPNVYDIVNAYGLSEAGIAVSNTIMKLDPETPTRRETPDFSAGKPFPDTRIQIRDIDNLELLGPNEKGEICIESKQIFHSYYKNPEATKKAFIGSFLRSGDIGYYDEQGYIYVVDRLKEIFKYYNNHISPSELENVIGKHPLVDEVCVIGIADPGGDVPRAFITVKSEASQQLADEIKEFANSKLPGYKHLRGGLYIVPELPKGKSGKVTRTLVAQINV